MFLTREMSRESSVTSLLPNTDYHKKFPFLKCANGARYGANNRLNSLLHVIFDYYNQNSYMAHLFRFI